MVGLTLTSLHLVVLGEPIGCPKCLVYHCLLHTFWYRSVPIPDLIAFQLKPSVKCARPFECFLSILIRSTLVFRFFSHHSVVRILFGLFRFPANSEWLQRYLC